MEQRGWRVGCAGRRLVGWLRMTLRARRPARFYTMSPDGKLVRGSKDTPLKRR
jgi:hypothetical protein